MQLFLAIAVVAIGYLIGSIPFGLVIVRLKTGKDIRKVESGRTGGTNALRAAGFWAGFATAVLDMLKASVTVLIARLIVPGNHWVEVLAPIAAVLGHNYSIFLPERTPNGNFRLRGGAGGAPSAGGAFGLWPPVLLFILPIGLLLLYFLGYASVATMSVPLIASVVFAYRAWIGVSPWQYVLYGIVVEIILIIALLPNIRRLFNGSERVVGWRARGKKSKPEENQKTT